MDALAIVANVGLQNEVYALRKRCFLPPFLELDHAFWKELQEAHDDGDGEVYVSPCTLAAVIMEYSYKHSPRDTLTRLATVCNTMACQYPATGQCANKKSTMSCSFIWKSIQHRKSLATSGSHRTGVITESCSCTSDCSDTVSDTVEFRSGKITKTWAAKHGQMPYSSIPVYAHGNL